MDIHKSQSRIDKLAENRLPRLRSKSLSVKRQSTVQSHLAARSRYTAPTNG